MNRIEQHQKQGAFRAFQLDGNVPLDPAFQGTLERIDVALRTGLGIKPEQTAIGALDLKTLRLAMVRPHQLMYGASIPKISILLAFFDLNRKAIQDLDASTRGELGLMIKKSSNEMATRFSRPLGLAAIQRVLDHHGFYDRGGLGGIWMGKHYADNSERIGDPLGDHSHAVTVMQLLRFYLLLEQGKLISGDACVRMREIFASPEIAHDPIKFVKGLRGRPVEIMRKWGSWEEWLHDSAVIHSQTKHYILVGLTHHRAGDQYLVELVAQVDDWLDG